MLFTSSNGENTARNNTFQHSSNQIFPLLGANASSITKFLLNKLKKSALFTVLVLLGLLAVSAQQSGQISGKISDTNGGIVKGAKVSARNQASGEQFSVQTDGNGDYSFENLPNGNYRITAEGKGFSSSSREISVNSGINQNIDIVLSVGNISESVTITATRTQVATTDTAVPVTVLTREDLERKTLNSIGDIFRDLPGTSTVNEGAFQVRPRIRGLDSNRILILVDGERLNNARTSTGQSGIEIGLVEPEQIETLEVVRGAGSVLYGTDALAGTVNIITKDAPQNRDGGFRFGGTFNGYFSSNEKGRRGNLAVTGASKFFSFRVAQSLERYGNYFTGETNGLGLDATDGFLSADEVGNSQSHGSNTQLTTRFFFNDNNDLKLNYERRLGRNIGSPLLTLDFGFNAYFPFSNRDKFNGRFESRNLNKYLAKVAGTFYVQNQKRNFTNQTIFLPFVNSLSETITDTRSYGFDVQTNWILGSKNFLTGGISYFRDENEDSRLALNRLTNVANRTTSVPIADFGSFAGFVQDEFEITKRLRLVGGIRVERFFSSSTQTDGFALPPTLTASQLEDLGITGLDTGLSVSETAVTGDFGAVFRVTDEISLSGRIGRSFRVANLFERFFTGAGSIGGFLVGNPNLEPESGINFDTSVKVKTSKYAGSVTYFNNYYRDFLSSQNSFDRNGAAITLPPTRPGGARIPVSQTINLGRVRIQGIEAEFEMPFRIGSGFLTPGGNISYLRGDNLAINSQTSDQPLNTITPLKTVLNLRWQDVQRNYYADWTTRITNKQERLSTSFLAANLGAEPGFAVSDIRGGYTFQRERYRMSVNVGITNLFDRFYTEQFVFAPARGRSFVAGTTWEIF
jgi:hemoglobin/transferrin/lactoferrin receptor protein